METKMKTTPAGLITKIPNGYYIDDQKPEPNRLEDTTFSVGTIVVTPAAMEALEIEGAGKFLAFLLRYASRFTSATRSKTNRQAASGTRFDLMTGETLLVMLEAEEQITTVMSLDESLK
jgi:hypothetical protein